MAYEDQDNPASDILKEYEHLKSNRSAWEGQWNQIAEMVIPRRADFHNRDRNPGNERRQKIFDSTPVRALTRFAAGMHNILTPAAAPWFILKPRVRALEQNRNVNLWLEETTKQIQMFMSRPQCNFHPAVYEYYADLGAFGTAIMFIEDVPGEGPMYRNFPLSDCILATDNYGRIDTVFRHHKQTAKALIEQFPPENLSEKVIKSMEAGKPYETFECFHVVKPWHSLKPSPLQTIEKPWISLHILKDDKKILGIGGYDQFPYVCSRWARNAIEIYGRGPGGDALPDIRMLNEMEKTYLKGLQKQVDPALTLPDDGFISPLKTYAGALNFHRAGFTSSDMIGEIPTGEPRYADAKMGQVREAIDKAFYLDLMELPGPVAQDGDVLRFTATEIAMRQRDRLVILGPIVARQEAEFLSPLIERTFMLMMRAGMLPPPPQEMVDVDFMIEYVNPVSVSMRSVELNAVSQLMQFIMPLAQIDPMAIERLNISRITELGAEILRAPASAIRTNEEMQEIMEARQEQQMAEQQMLASQMASEVDKNVADAEAKRRIN